MPSLKILLDNDAEALRQHQRNKDEWGARGWAKLNDICLWFQVQNVEGLPCLVEGQLQQRLHRDARVVNDR